MNNSLDICLLQVEKIDLVRVSDILSKKAKSLTIRPCVSSFFASNLSCLRDKDIFSILVFKMFMLYFNGLSNDGYVVRKGVSANNPPPFLRHPTLDPACLPFLNFLFHPLLRYFRQFPHPHVNSSCPNPINQPFLA